MRLATVVLFPALLLLLVEGGLRLAGFGYSTSYFERTADGTNLTTNPRFAWQFYSRETSTAPTPLLFPAVKPPGTIRIVVLGESAAAGTPDPAFSFSRMLEHMLRQQYPAKRFEVINAAMRGINSHIILPIARECADLAPDLTIVYAGNNEMIGLHSPTPGEFSFTPYLRLLRLGHAIKSTRLSQLVQSALRRFLPAPANKRQDMEYLRTQRLAFDDPRRNAVYENFRANLADICDVMGRGGAPVILSSVAVNMRDFPPLASLHRTDLTEPQLKEWEHHYAKGTEAESLARHTEALGHFQAAARNDDHFAALHFRLARCYAATGKLELAQTYFALARDWDALQFRTDSRMNDMVRQVATNRAAPGIHYVDADAWFAQDAVRSHRLFHEHVHFTFDGDYHLAKSLLPVVAGQLKLPTVTNAPPTRDDCARVLAFTPMDDINVLAAMAQQTSKPPFLDQLDHASRQSEAERIVKDRLSRATTLDFDFAAKVYRDAIARRPDDWMLRYNFGNLFVQFSRHADAIAEYEFVVNRHPNHRVFRMALGNALLRTERRAEALAQFQAVQKMYPDYPPVLDAIAATTRFPR